MIAEMGWTLALDHIEAINFDVEPIDERRSSCTPNPTRPTTLVATISSNQVEKWPGNHAQKEVGRSCSRSRSDAMLFHDEVRCNDHGSKQ